VPSRSLSDQSPPLQAKEGRCCKAGLLCSIIKEISEISDEIQNLPPVYYCSQADHSQLNGTVAVFRRKTIRAEENPGFKMEVLRVSELSDSLISCQILADQSGVNQ
jgi:hypothetical protein